MREWRETTLADICIDISYGYTESAKFENVGPKFLRITDIASGRPNWSNVPYCPISELDYNKYKLYPGDIVIARTGATTGVNYIIKHSDPKNVVFASYLIRYKINKKIANPFFIGHVLKSCYWSDYVDAIAGGSAQPGANAKQLGSFEISLPPLSEQTATASILSSLDDKIDLLHRQNETLEKMAETLFRQWFVEEAEEEWENGKLVDILQTIESGSRPKGGIDPNLTNGIASIGAESINGIGAFDFSKTRFVSIEFFKNLKKGIVKNYDVLIYKDGAYIGRKGMFGNGFPFKDFAVNEHVFILRANKRASQYFLYFLLQQEELSLLNANSAQPGLNQKAMKSFEIIIPQKNMIDNFDMIVKPWIDKILFNSKQIRTLTQLRDTLLPKLMNGDVRVKM